jgi:hypothetical protein
MHMGSSRLKTQIYLLIVSAIVSLIGMAVVKSNQSTPAVSRAKPTTAVQQLDALGKIAPRSSQMSKFIRNERAAQEANDEAAKELPK